MTAHVPPVLSVYRKGATLTSMMTHLAARAMMRLRGDFDHLPRIHSAQSLAMGVPLDPAGPLWAEAAFEVLRPFGAPLDDDRTLSLADAAGDSFRAQFARAEAFLDMEEWTRLPWNFWPAYVLCSRGLQGQGPGPMIALVDDSRAVPDGIRRLRFVVHYVRRRK